LGFQSILKEHSDSNPVIISLQKEPERTVIGFKPLKFIDKNVNKKSIFSAIYWVSIHAAILNFNKKSKIRKYYRALDTDPASSKALKMIFLIALQLWASSCPKSFHCQIDEKSKI